MTSMSLPTTPAIWILATWTRAVEVKDFLLERLETGEYACKGGSASCCAGDGRQHFGEDRSEVDVDEKGAVAIEISSDEIPEEAFDVAYRVSVMGMGKLNITFDRS